MSTTSPFKVIIADDHQIVVNGLLTLLSKEKDMECVGYAHTGEELLQAVNQLDINTIILDLNMPSINYVALIKQLLINTRNFKIIAFTAYNSPKLIKSVLDLGIHGFLCKAVSEKEISKAIRSVHKGEIYIGKTILNPPLPNNLDDPFLKEIELTPRERDIVVLIANGFTNKKMAEELFISQHTIETHRKNIMQKLQLDSSADLVKFAVKQGMV